MEWIGWILAGLAAVTLQVAVVPVLFGGQVRPDLVLLFVIVMAAYRKGWGPMVLAWFLGLMVDQHSLERSGVVALSYLLVTVGISMIRPLIALGRSFALALATLVAALMVQLLWCSYLRFMYPASSGSWEQPMQIAFYSAAMTALLALPVSALLRTFKLREARRIRIRPSR